MRWQVPRVTKEHRLHLPLPATECWQSTMKGVQFELRVQGLISAISQPDPPLLICRLRRLISGLPSPLKDPAWVERQWAWMVDEKEMLALSWPAVRDHWRQLHIWAPRAPPPRPLREWFQLQGAICNPHPKDQTRIFTILGCLRTKVLAVLVPVV